jgi:hypothetical protein
MITGPPPKFHGARDILTRGFGVRRRGLNRRLIRRDRTARLYSKRLPGRMYQAALPRLCRYSRARRRAKMMFVRKGSRDPATQPSRQSVASQDPLMTDQGRPDGSQVARGVTCIPRSTMWLALKSMAVAATVLDEMDHLANSISKSHSSYSAAALRDRHPRLGRLVQPLRLYEAFETSAVGLRLCVRGCDCCGRL